MQVLIAELQTRWQAMFTALVAGDDVSPAQRLRTEGLMEAAVLMSVATPAALTDAMDRCYQSAYGCSIADHFGADWQDFFPFPQIPAMAKRAPVYPSTKD
ncbi:MAG: hypothetical protein KDI17_06340 [Halioglobus sp.]|jgi:hypothetical protein|nr:hypothetical protein [Halioglobus sp.]